MALTPDLAALIESISPNGAELAGGGSSLHLADLLGDGSGVGAAASLAGGSTAGPAGQPGKDGLPGATGATGQPGPAGRDGQSIVQAIGGTLFGPRPSVSEFTTGTAAPAAAPDDEPDPRGGVARVLEAVKLGLDAVGLVDPTGIADLGSGAISLGQGIHKAATGQEGAGRHFVDAGISAVSAIPGGDILKVAKAPGYLKESKAIAKATKAAYGAARGYKRAHVESQLGGLGQVLAMLEASGGIGSTGHHAGGPDLSISAAGGGTFVTDRQTNLTVGENGPEFVQVTPLGQAGQTTFHDGPGGPGGFASASMAGGGGLVAGQAESDVLHGMASTGGTMLAATLTGDFRSLGIEVAKMPLTIRDWGDALVDSKRSLADFSSDLAAVFAEADIREIGRDIKTGETVGPSVAALSDAQQDLSDSLRPWKDLTSIVGNTIVEKLTRLVDNVVKVVNALIPVEEIADIARKMSDDDDKAAKGLGDFLQQLEDASDPTKGRRIGPR